MVTACTEHEAAASELEPYAFAASDYLYSPLRDQNDQGDTYEEIVAHCMKDQGFDYLGLADASNSTLDDDDEAPSSQFSLPEAGTIGYGVVFPFEEFGDADNLSTPTVDPLTSQDPLASLSPSEAEAYGAALYGTYGDDLAADPDAVWEWTRAGCLGAAEHQLMIAPETRSGANPFEDLMNDVLDTPIQVLEGSEWNAVIESWSKCMAAGGYDGFRSLEDAVRSIEQERRVLLDSVRLPDSTSEMIVVTEGNDGIPERKEWEALQRREIDQAEADARCRNKADLDVEYERIYAEVERRFIDTNRAELDKMMIWISENSE